MSEVKKTFVTLKVKGEKGREQKFEIAQANALLKIKNSQWELKDEKFTYNGTEIAPKPTK